MVDYSRFDRIDVGDDSEGEGEAEQNPSRRALPTEPQPSVESAAAGAGSSGASAAAGGGFEVTKKGQEGRLKFEYQGRTVYEWEQTLEDVTLYITPPPGVKSSMVACTIGHRHLTLGLKGLPPFIDEDTAGAVKAGDSFWTMEDGELHVTLQKMSKGEMWPSALAGRGQMDPVTSEEVKKKLMLERFQEENPGFDFSNAEFDGQVPDPQTFMGGVKYT